MSTLPLGDDIEFFNISYVNAALSEKYFDSENSHLFLSL